MAYVAPNSTLQLFKGINLDNRYLHTIYFASESAQDTWFSGKVFKTYNNLMYRRYTDESVKVEADATELLGVTYMRFKNTRSASKWFYAFVLGIEYVNENTCIITYEIDVMQTWFIQNGSVRPCRVLREHVNDDTIFSHLETEPIGSDVYEYDYITDANTLSGGTPTSSDKIFKEYSVCITATGKSTTGNYKQGLFDGTYHRAVHCDDTTGADSVITALDTYLGDWDSGEQTQNVIDMTTFPSYFADRSYSTDLSPVTKVVNGVNIIGPDLQHAYIPKNMKLFSYPFNYLYCTTHNGASTIYRWEYFDNGNATNSMTNKSFKIAGSFIGGGQIKCYPLNYAGVAENYESGIAMSDFPKNAFVYDAYQAWVAAGGKTRLENEQKIVMARGVTNITAAGFDFANTSVQSGIDFGNAIQGKSSLTGRHINRSTENIISRGANDVNNIIQSGAKLANAIIDFQEAKNKIDYQWKDASYRPNEVVGTSEPSIMVGGRMLNFYFYNCHVKRSELVKIDDFLTCYGYAVNKVKQPNITGRKYFNFVQTEQCEIAGDMPSSSKAAIGRIFDGGITFWHDGDQIGNYAQSVTQGSINNPIV